MTGPTPSLRPSLSAATVPAHPFLVQVQPPVTTRPVEVLPPAGIVTQRLVLRALTPADKPAFTDLLARSRDHLRGRINVRSRAESDGATFDRLLAATETGDARGTQWRRAAFLHSGQPVGMVHVLDIQRGMIFRGDAGWWVAPFHCGNGVASEMVVAMARHAHRDLPAGLGLHTLSAAIAPQNAASQRVAAKAGFTRVPDATTNVVIDGAHEVHEVWEAHAPA